MCLPLFVVGLGSCYGIGALFDEFLPLIALIVGFVFGLMSKCWLCGRVVLGCGFGDLGILIGRLRRVSHVVRFRLMIGVPCEGDPHLSQR